MKFEYQIIAMKAEIDQIKAKKIQLPIDKMRIKELRRQIAKAKKWIDQ